MTWERPNASDHLPALAGAWVIYLGAYSGVRGSCIMSLDMLP